MKRFLATKKFLGMHHRYRCSCSLTFHSSASDDDRGRRRKRDVTPEADPFLIEGTADEKRWRLAKEILSRVRTEEDVDEIDTNEAVAARLKRAVVKIITIVSHAVLISFCSGRVFRQVSATGWRKGAGVLVSFVYLEWQLLIICLLLAPIAHVPCVCVFVAP